MCLVFHVVDRVSDGGSAQHSVGKNTTVESRSSPELLGLTVAWLLKESLTSQIKCLVDKELRESCSTPWMPFLWTEWLMCPRVLCILGALTWSLLAIRLLSGGALHVSLKMENALVLNSVIA